MSYNGNESVEKCLALSVLPIGVSQFKFYSPPLSRPCAPTMVSLLLPGRDDKNHVREAYSDPKSAILASSQVKNI